MIVEHDIVPHAGAVEELWDCPEPWCGFPYLIKGRLQPALGCTKFDPEALGIDYPCDDVSWQHQDVQLLLHLEMAGHRLHLHQPAVKHLHPEHSRGMTELEAQLVDRELMILAQPDDGGPPYFYSTFFRHEAPPYEELTSAILSIVSVMGPQPATWTAQTAVLQGSCHTPGV